MEAICSEVEMNKLSLLRPTMLLKHDFMLIDRKDFEDIRHSDNNGWRKIMKNNLNFLYDIGAVRVKDFESELSKEQRKAIKKKGNQIVNKLKKKEKRLLLLHAWKEFISYIETKAFHLQANEKDYRKQTAFLNSLYKRYNNIEQNNWDEEVQDFILQNCFWKTLASSIVSKRLDNSTLHLANEYEPFLEYVKPIQQNERVTALDSIIKHVYSLSLPSVTINNFNEQKAFIELRKNKLKEFLNLCEELDSILQDFRKYSREEDYILETKEYLTDRWSYGYQSIEGFFNKLKNKALLPEYIVQVIMKTFKYFFPAMPDIPVPSDNIKEISKGISNRPLSALKSSSEEWQVAFCTVFNEKEIKRIKRSLRKDHSSTYDGTLSNWVENIGELPWYVK